MTVADQKRSVKAFKAYDIRGRVPDELDEYIALRIGTGMAALLGDGPVVVGRDVRLSSGALQEAVIRGLLQCGRDVIDIELCGTEEVYFQTFHRMAAGGVMVTASHNPMDYNGMKLVREDAKPISGDSGLFAIRDHVAEEGDAPHPTRIGRRESAPDKSSYIRHLLGYVDTAVIRPLKVVVNSGNGGAGLVIDQLAPHLPLEFVRIQHEPDGRFPHGIPNPLLLERRQTTVDAVLEHGADFGIAWDGDFDRCFFFDGKGQFIEGYYMVGLLASAILARNPGANIIHDPRLLWNTQKIVDEAGGVAIMSKTGHAFIKERMRRENAVYGGEMSAHHYFREFAYCDSGMIPWLLVAQLISTTGLSLSELVEQRQRAFPCSGEINFKVDDTVAATRRVVDHFAGLTPSLDHTDGVSADFGQWRFNLRSSNTEPLLRLNVESRGDAALMHDRTLLISTLIDA